MAQIIHGDLQTLRGRSRDRSPVAAQLLGRAVEPFLPRVLAERFEMIESHWSLATRELEREVVPLVLDQQLGLLVWGPLLGGLLTGKFSRDGVGPAEDRTAGQVPPVLSPSWSRVSCPFA